MKKIILLVITLLTIYGFYGFKIHNETALENSNGIHFYKGTWKNALIEAKKQDKLIFLDVFATWCGPCKKLKKTTFNDEKVGDFFNLNFINIAINGESNEGRILMKKYGIKGYPSLLFVNFNGNLKTIKTGFHSSNRLINYGKKALN